MKTIEDLLIDLRNIPEEVKKRINKEELGRSIVEMILDRVQNGGMGVKQMGDTPEFFERLKDSSIKKRTYLQRNKKLSDKTTPDTSNQTETGRMLDSLTYKSVPEGIQIYISDPDRQDVYDHQSKDRPWLFFTNEELEHIDSTYEKAINEAFSLFQQT